MAESPLRLIKYCAEFQAKERVEDVPKGRRGLYVLYRSSQVDSKERYDVVYVGMATRSMRFRLKSHVKSVKKGSLWTHFSVFEVWDNIRDEEIVELEGLFRHLYRRDSRANELNVQRRFMKVAKVRFDDFGDWS